MVLSYDFRLKACLDNSRCYRMAPAIYSHFAHQPHATPTILLQSKTIWFVKTSFEQNTFYSSSTNGIRTFIYSPSKNFESGNKYCGLGGGYISTLLISLK